MRVEQEVLQMSNTPNLIKNWTVEKWGHDFVICGNIYNDTRHRFTDGTPIHTSKVKSIDFVTGLVETKNSVYVLETRGADNEQRETD